MASSNMLTKFESKSSRAKGIAFHAKRPWILVALHSSTIQLWDYRMGTLVDRFEEHDGPVRGIDFHQSQPMFVSGGDDYKIKVWNYNSRKCLFTLAGHLDYVRTVFFHSELPWILSSSDDQTVRIWNWQNRTLICTMTGHSHYAMCAQFHPKQDLVVSASLDQSVRVWDISGLRKKHSAPASTMMTLEDQLARANSSQADVFANTDAIVKFVLDGHDRGVNWVAFHPTLPLIVSAGDDRLVKLWRMSETKAWEVDTCRGHMKNVSSCLFHPHQDLIISVGEDNTIRVWDLNKRTSVQSFKRESDRFWAIAAHPTINLFAAGHDNGVMVFKLERERPASVLSPNGKLYFVTRDKQVRLFDFNNSKESPSIISLKNKSSPWKRPRTISHNPFEKSLLVISGDTFELVNLPKDATGSVEPSVTCSGTADSAVWIKKDQFAVFSASVAKIFIKDTNNTTIQAIQTPTGATDISFAGISTLLILTPTSVILYDVVNNKKVAELDVMGVKYVVWTPDYSHAALLSKHKIAIVTKNLLQVSSLHETIRIKSAAWDDAGVLLYTTLNHVKYMLKNGDNGTICTQEETAYIVKVSATPKESKLYCLDRSAKVKVVDFDPTEYRFKLALIKGNYDDMLKMIKGTKSGGSSLIGQAIIAYVQKRGYPEIALEFVQDPKARFYLAVECGSLNIALSMAQKIDRPAIWERLAKEALSYGNHKIVEVAYQKLCSFDRLSFLYLITGDRHKLKRMTKIAKSRGENEPLFENALFLDDVDARIQMLKEAELRKFLFPPHQNQQLMTIAAMAYLTAKSNGLDEEAASILEAAGIDEANVKVPAAVKSRIPKPVVATFKNNWPLHSDGAAKSIAALLGSQEDDEEDEDDDEEEEEEEYDDYASAHSEEVEADLIRINE